MFDRYAENRGTGSFILIDPATQFTCGAGMITDPVREARRPRTRRRSRSPNGSPTLARHAASDEEAAEAVRKALEEMLT